MPLGETITALSTPAGQSAIALVRVSGPMVLELSAGALGREEPEGRRALLADYVDVEGVVLDQVLMTYFPGESSYTGEDLLEIACHGNPLIVQRVTEDLVRRGCRMAEGGEFTRTAYVNGKLDLSQAEAVCDLIRARSERALAASQRQLRGALGDAVSAYTDRLLGVIAQLEAYIDFPEEDLPVEDEAGPVREMERLVREFEELMRTSHYKALMQEGVKTVIMGAPNAGKSSLLNALMGEERAIVSEVAGTTRDFISETLMMGEHCIRIMDTAGIHEAGDAIERVGIERTLEQVALAELHLLVVDVTTGEIPELGEELTPENTLLVLNKVDLEGEADLGKRWEGYERVKVSLKTGEGMGALRSGVGEMLDRHIVDLGPHELVVSARHATALEKAKEAIEGALEKVAAGEAGELVASDLHYALVGIGEIVGRVDNERMLDKLFANFCIGK